MREVDSGRSHLHVSWGRMTTLCKELDSRVCIVSRSIEKGPLGISSRLAIKERTIHTYNGVCIAGKKTHTRAWWLRILFWHHCDPFFVFRSLFFLF